MKTTIITVIIVAKVIATSFIYGQGTYQNPVVINNKGFNSVFNDVKSGKYSGTANGALFLKNPQGKSVILDFQGSQLNLILQHDPDEVYDVSYKKYNAVTTSGKTKIDYETYASANELTIEYQNQVFSAGIIDGACDLIIDGLSYTYMAEKETEYLTLIIKKKIQMSNTSFLWDKIGSVYSDDNRKIVEKNEQFIWLQPNSVLIFAVSRK